MKEIIVAGAGKGIGKATADLVYEKGYKVIAISKNKSDIMGRPYKTIGLDLKLENNISELLNVSGGVENIINCTGTHPGEQILNIGWSYRVVDIIEKNVEPALVLYEAFLNKFREIRKGHFIHLSSVSMDSFNENEAGYCASKAALEAVVLSLQSKDLGLNTGVLHHLIRVPLTDTPLARKVCREIKDWSKFYTAREIASYLIDVVENPENYNEIVVKIPNLPLRIN